MTDDLAAQLLEEVRALRAEVRALKGEPLFTREKAARLLGVHPRTFDRMRAQGRVSRGQKIGGLWRWTGAELRGG